MVCVRGAGGDSDASRDGIDEREAEENRRFAAAADAVRPTQPHDDRQCCLSCGRLCGLSGFVAVLMRLALSPQARAALPAHASAAVILLAISLTPSTQSKPI